MLAKSIFERSTELCIGCKRASRSSTRSMASPSPTPKTASASIKKGFAKEPHSLHTK